MLERILDLMERKGVKPATLLKEAGLNSSSIQDWKKGKAKPSYGALVKIAEYFNVSVEYLEGKTDDTAPHDKLIEVYFRGIEVWSSNEFLSDEERSNAKRHFAELLFRYKDFMNAYCDEKVNAVTSPLSKKVESLAVWISLLPEYIAGVEPKSNSSEMPDAALIKKIQTLSPEKRKAVETLLG